MNVEQKRVVKVLGNMVQLVKNDEYYAEMFTDFLDSELEQLRDEDAFGTEGQSDPRGDGRDGDFYMGFVQGVDTEE